MAVVGNNLNGFAAHELRELTGHVHGYKLPTAQMLNVSLDSKFQHS